METIELQLQELCGALRQTSENMNKVLKVYDNINAINYTMSSLLGAMALRRSCFKVEEKPIVLPSPPSLNMKQVTFEEAPIVVKEEEKREVKVEEIPIVKRRQWRWKKGVKARVPKVYRTPQGIEQMESLLFYIADAAEAGCSLSELVKYSAMSVLKCKEMIQTLVRLKLISQSREKTGFVYKKI